MSPLTVDDAVREYSGTREHHEALLLALLSRFDDDTLSAPPPPLRTGNSSNKDDMDTPSSKLTREASHNANYERACSEGND